ncbi:MAG: hypothetical protein ABJN36_16435 [Cyclobacteriaceae bacterium]
MKQLVGLLIFMSIVHTQATAQINLRDKLNKKAEQEIDKILFGKKTNKQSSKNGTSVETVSESQEAIDGSDPLEGYERKSVDYGGLSHLEVVSFRDLINFLPDSFGSYSISEKPDGGTMRYGEFQYSSGEKMYSSDNSELKASAFDYLQTGTFLAAYTSQYEYESTDGIVKSIEVKGQPGWYNADYDSGETSVTLVINSRFLIMISGSDHDENTLKGYLNQLDIESLPEAPEEETISDD